MADVPTQTINRLLKEGEERGRQLESIDHKLDSLSKWRIYIDKRIDKHQHTLFGNGEPGWDEVMRRLVVFVDKQEKKEAERWSETKKFVLGVLAFIVNTLIAVWMARLIP